MAIRKQNKTSNIQATFAIDNWLATSYLYIKVGLYHVRLIWYIYCRLSTSSSSSVFCPGSFLAALDLHCCAQAFSSCGARGLLFVAVLWLLTAVASVVERGL